MKYRIERCRVEVEVKGKKGDLSLAHKIQSRLLLTLRGGVFEGKHMCVLYERVHVYVYYVRSVASKAQISLTLQSPLILKQILQDAAPHRDESGVH